MFCFDTIETVIEPLVDIIALKGLDMLRQMQAATAYDPLYKSVDEKADDDLEKDAEIGEKLSNKAKKTSINGERSDARKPKRMVQCGRLQVTLGYH